jgi:hypothetical protein
MEITPSLFNDRSLELLEAKKEETERGVKPGRN